MKYLLFIMAAIAIACCPKTTTECQQCTAHNTDSILSIAPNTFVFLAEGFEETEAIAPLDILRRGGVNVHTVSITDCKNVKGDNGVTVTADFTLNDIKKHDAEMLIFPGGFLGSKNLASCDTLMSMLQKHYLAGKKIAAICAAPAFVLSKLPLPDTLPICVYPDPSLEEMLKGHNIVKQGVVSNEQIITGRGPGYSFDFGYAILAKLKGQKTASELAQGMLYPTNK